MKYANVVAKALLVNPDGKILLLKRSSTTKNRPDEWDLPGGHVDEGEDFTAAAKREIVEEAGLDVPEADLHLAYTWTGLKKGNRVCWLFFIAKNPDPSEVVLSDEHSEALWMTLDKALEALEYQLHINFLTYVRDNNLLETS